MHALLALPSSYHHIRANALTTPLASDQVSGIVATRYTVQVIVDKNATPPTIEQLLSFLHGLPQPQVFGFKFLDPKNVKVIFQQPTGETLLMDDSVPLFVKAINLLSCASVVFQNTSLTAPTPQAFVYHAPSGVMSNSDTTSALDEVRGDGNHANIVVVFAHPGPGSQGYTNSLNNIINAGVLTNKIIEITDLPVDSFGMNQNGFLG